jgi:hypothetical protein
MNSMTNKSMIEISESSFLIKLNKEEFSIQQIKNALAQLSLWPQEDMREPLKDEQWLDHSWNSRFDQLCDK